MADLIGNDGPPPKTATTFESTNIAAFLKAARPKARRPLGSPAGPQKMSLAEAMRRKQEQEAYLDELE